MRDEEIIALFFERSEQAIEALRDKYGVPVRCVARNILGSRQDAEECENDTYLGCWNSIPPHRPDPLKTYVCRIARNLAVTRFCLAFVILSVIFYKRLLHGNVRDIKCGAALILSGIVLQNVRIKLPEKAHN